MRWNLWISIVITLLACGGASGSGESTRTAESADSADSEAQAPSGIEEVAARGTIDRAALEAVLEAGLGRFLQGVETEPQMEEGRFVGFRLSTLFPGDARMASIDLKPGDVVTRVNGASIERPEQALSVWNGLRVASELRIEYQRDGAERQLRFEIVD